MKNIAFFGYRHTLRRGVLLVVRRVPCAEVVGATSSEGILVVYKNLHLQSLSRTK